MVVAIITLAVVIGSVRVGRKPPQVNSTTSLLLNFISARRVRYILG